MDNNGLTEKLNLFTSLVLEDAEDKRDRLLEKVEKEYAARIDEKETEILQGAYEDIQQGIRDIRQNANERVLHSELEAKKKLIMRREEIIGEIMTAAVAKLSEFKKSEDYEKWLLEKVKKAAFEVGDGAKTVYISSDDIRFKDKIESIFDESVTVEAGESDFFGGVKLLNTDRRVAVDYSFKEMLAEQKQKFLKGSGLSIG